MLLQPSKGASNNYMECTNPYAPTLKISTKWTFGQQMGLDSALSRLDISKAIESEMKCLSRMYKKSMF